MNYRYFLLLTLLTVSALGLFGSCGIEPEEYEVDTTRREPSNCFLADGTEITHGTQFVGYESSGVLNGETCRSQIQTCTDGNVSDNYLYSSCEVAAADGCLFNGQVVDNGESVVAYSSNTIQYAGQCSSISEARVCANGALTGDYQYSTCAPENPDDCYLDGQTIPSGTSVVAYLYKSVSSDNQCSGFNDENDEARTCLNGSLSGSFPYTTCNVAPPANYVATSNAGTEFILTFTPNYSTSNTRRLNIAGFADNTSFSIIYPDGTSDNYSVSSNSVKEITVSSQYEVTSGTESNRILRITSENAIVVYGVNQLSATTDAFTVTPKVNLGREYIVSTYSILDTIPSVFTILADDNSTNIDIVYPSGSSENINLNSGDTYTKRSSSEDLTGTYISSSKDIAVFSGNLCANIPVDKSACDMIVEQMISTDFWKTEYLTVPLAGRTKGDTFRVIASENETSFSLNGSVIEDNMSRGEFWETNTLAVRSKFTSNKPISVVQYSNGQSFDNIPADPFMMLIPGVDQYLDEYNFATPPTGFDKHYVTIIHPTATVDELILDNNTYVSSFREIDNTSYSGAQIQISNGSHRAYSSAPFGIFVYGFGNADSYGYPGGFNLQ